MKKRIYVAAFSLLFTVTIGSVDAQEIATYNLNRTLPQANILNPSFNPDYILSIGLPSPYAKLSLGGLRLSDFIVNDSIVDLNNAADAFAQTQSFNLSADAQLFYLGFRIGRNYVTAQANHHTSASFSIPGSLFSNDYSDIFIDFGRLNARVLSYTDVAAGITRPFFDNRLRVGLTAHYIQGHGYIGTNAIDGSLTVNPSEITINTNNVDVSAAGIVLIDSLQNTFNGTGNWRNWALNSNRGYKLDLGMQYFLTPKLSVSASVLDLGFISWNEYTEGISLDGVNYSFTGISPFDLGELDTFLTQQVDSIQSLFVVDSTTENFRTTFSPRIYSGLHYDLLFNRFSVVGGLNRIQPLDPFVQLSYNIKFLRMFEASVGGGYANGTWGNINAGFTVKLANLQVFATVNHLEPALDITNTSTVDARVGINLVFGNPKNVKVKKRDREEEILEEEEAQIAELTEEADMAEDDTTEVVTDAVQEEAMQEEIITEVPEETVQQEEDTIQNEQRQPQPVIVPIPVASGTEDTSSAVEPPVSQVQTPENATVIPEEQPLKTESDGEPTITFIQGNHPEELPLGHYVIVGVFSQLENVESYSRQLARSGYMNSYGFVSERGAWYVHIYSHPDDISKAREIRDEIRQKNQFQFANAWVLTMKKP